MEIGGDTMFNSESTPLTLEELSRRLNSLQATVEAQQKKLNAIQKELDNQKNINKLLSDAIRARALKEV